LTSEVQTLQTHGIDESEDQRLRYEARINELDTIAKQYTETILQLEAAITERDGEIKRLRDIEEQKNGA